MPGFYKQVLEFTRESGAAVPVAIKPMDRPTVLQLIRMMNSELVELLQTVQEPGEDVLETMRGLVGWRFKEAATPADDVSLIAAQADSLVDSMYYGYNGAAKHLMDIDKVFAIVHDANMRKRWPDGTFHRNAEGYVMKPADWTPPEPLIEAEIRNQLMHPEIYQYDGEGDAEDDDSWITPSTGEPAVDATPGDCWKPDSNDENDDECHGCDHCVMNPDSEVHCG